MFVKLRQAIEEIRCGNNNPKDEAGIKQRIILKFLQILDWDTYTEEVIPEYSVGDKRVDYCLRLNRLNKVFIECKKSDEDLSNKKNQEQLLNYAFHEGIELAILTNGYTWEFYLPLNPGSWEERKFFSIDIIQQDIDEIIKNFIGILKKENIDKGKGVEQGKNFLKLISKTKLIENNLPKAWDKLITETDDQLLDLLNYTLEKICGIRADIDKVSDFIFQNRQKFLFNEIQKNSIPNISDNTGKKITKFIFNEKEYSVNSWKKFLIDFLMIIYKANIDDFSKVETLKGKKRKYFSKNPDEIFKPEKINESGYFVDKNLSANRIVKIAYDVLNLFGYNKDNLKIICSE